MSTPQERKEVDAVETILGHNHHKCIGGEPCPMANEMLQLLDQARSDAIGEAADTVFIDIPTGHELTKVALLHESACSQYEGFMCDCSVLKAAQYAVDKAKERCLALQLKASGQKRGV